MMVPLRGFGFGVSVADLKGMRFGWGWRDRFLAQDFCAELLTCLDEREDVLRLYRCQQKP